MTYEEYLKSLGATDADIATMNNPVAKKMFEETQRQIATAAQETKRAQDLVKANQEWRDNTIQPLLERTSAERDLAVAEAAAQKARLKALEEAGLVTKEPEKKTPVADPNGFDPSKYVSRDEVLKLAQATADSDDLIYDIAAEHSRLFPDKPLSMRQLRQRAIANKSTIEQQWQNDFNVQAAREARATAEREAQQKKWMEEGAKAKEQELATKYGSPETRPAVPSNSPFTNKTQPTAADGRVLQPWERTEGDRAASRVRGALAAGNQVN